MVARKKISASTVEPRITRGKAKALVSVVIEHTATAPPLLQLGTEIDEAAQAAPVKKRKLTSDSNLNPRTRAKKISVQASASSSASSSVSSIAHERDEIDTPATTISTESVASSEKLLKQATEKLSFTFTEADDYNEENEIKSENELDIEELQPTDDDSDEYAEKRKKPTKRKGKGKARAVASAPSVPARRRVSAVVDDDEESDLTEVPESDSDVQDNETEEDEEDYEEDDDGNILPPPVVNRAPNRSSLRSIYRPETNWRASRRRARAERQIEVLYSWHPELRTIWEDLDKREKIKIQQDPQPEGLTLTMMPFQLEGLYWLRNQEKTDFGGGILADEMGMGKTIQTIALLMAEPRQKPNLVVAPTVALMQWRNEIEKHTANALSVTVFHGANRSSDIKALQDCDVIMTTYSVLESMYRKQQHGFKRKVGLVKENSILHKIVYHRVILDEAHNIKDRTCNTAKAVFALKTKYKLCLSGTPLQNRIGEFFSLLRFLEADPFSYYFCRRCDCKSLHWSFKDHRSCDTCGHRPMEHCSWFNTELLKPIQQYGHEGDGKLAFEKLRKILGHLMLRRTKVEKADDLGLPPRLVRVRKDYFNEEELDLYDSIYGESRRKFDTYVAQGVVLNNYANIFTLITRMRQLADHPDLVLRKHAEGGQNTLVCCICDDEAEEAIASKCHHKFCRLCVSKYIESYDGDGAPDCPQCHVPLSIDLTQPAIEDFSNIKRGSIINRINMNNWRSSTKIEALVEELYKLRSKTQTIKTIVFSQFTSMLQLVEWRLHRGGFKTCMLEGSMSPPQRDAVIKHFMENVSVEVFLVSLKAGGVALNLTEASQVFILDPWWNPSVEWQSGDRVHRIGQKRSCKITRLVIEDSIESRIIELQEKKATMINATVNGDQKSMDKLTPADMQFLFQN